MKVASPPQKATRPEVLVVEDDASFRELLVPTIERRGYSVTEAASAAAARRLLGRRAFDVALVDVNLGDGSGLELIEPLRESAGAAQFVVMSALASSATIAEGFRRGAFDFLEKPIEPARLLGSLEQAIEKARLIRENVALRSTIAGSAVAAAPVERLGKAMRALYEQALLAATRDVPVLILGESGTGKEYVARAIHAASPRAHATWLPVNCGALRPQLVDSELFGYEKGAFTGATDRRLGLVEVARGGTLLLDEIAELPSDAQVSLLRFIDYGEFRRVGGTEVHASNVRILAATNRDVQTSIDSGRFREDLYFRLAVVTLHVPPLRQRPEDIPVYVENFLAHHGFETTFSPAVMRELQTRPWRGNLRELRNVVDRLVMAGGPERATVADLVPAVAVPGDASRKQEDVERTLADVEREHVARVLTHHGGNRTQAARTLGISIRTLYRKVHEYGLEPG